MDIYEEYKQLAENLDEDEREILGELEGELSEMEYAMMRDIAEQVCDPISDEEVEHMRELEISDLEHRLEQLREGVSPAKREEYEVERQEWLEEDGLDDIQKRVYRRVCDETRLPENLLMQMWEVRNDSLDYRYEDTLCSVIRERKYAS